MLSPYWEKRRRSIISYFFIPVFRPPNYFQYIPVTFTRADFRRPPVCFAVFHHPYGMKNQAL
jgi:hypothetical protein